MNKSLHQYFNYFINVKYCIFIKYLLFLKLTGQHIDATRTKFLPALCTKKCPGLQYFDSQRPAGVIRLFFLCFSLELAYTGSLGLHNPSSSRFPALSPAAVPRKETPALRGRFHRVEAFIRAEPSVKGARDRSLCFTGKNRGLYRELEGGEKQGTNGIYVTWMSIKGKNQRGTTINRELQRIIGGGEVPQPN